MLPEGTEHWETLYPCAVAKSHTVSPYWRVLETPWDGAVVVVPP